MSLYLHSGRVVGHRYTLTALIASGGMGDVWEAGDGVLDRDVAVKILRSGDGPEDEGFAERFRDEAKHAAALTHPNVAAVYDYGEEEDGTAYLVMERVPGVPLSEVIRRDGAVTPEQARWILGQAALALAAAHDTGLVHRDVKPGNIIVTPEGAAKLTDFGIARAGDGNGRTLTGEILGTPDYISPEQALGEPATSASDIYSLGVVAHEVLSGSKPFDMGTPVATALAHVNDTPPPLPEAVPADLRRVIMSCLSKDPKDRPASALDVARALGMPTDAVPPAVAVAAATMRMPSVTPSTPRWNTRVEARAHGAAGATGSAVRGRKRWLLPLLAVVVIGFALFVAKLVGGETSHASVTPRPSMTSTTPSPSTSSTAPTPTTTAPRTSVATAPPPPAPVQQPGKGRPAHPGKGKGHH